MSTVPDTYRSNLKEIHFWICFIKFLIRYLCIIKKKGISALKLSKHVVYKFMYIHSSLCSFIKPCFEIKTPHIHIYNFLITVTVILALFVTHNYLNKNMFIIYLHDTCISQAAVSISLGAFVNCSYLYHASKNIHIQKLRIISLCV